VRWVAAAHLPSMALNPVTLMVIQRALELTDPPGGSS
jgi:hypothetical protein